jgi:cullin-associated NEDD8-dissociated protein 1
LYNDGDLNFIANVGALIEPITGQEYRDKSKATPPGIFAHNIMQRNAQNLDPSNYAAKGVLGRMIDTFMRRVGGFASDIYSRVGNIKILEGVRAPDQIDRQNGVQRYTEYDTYAPLVNNMTRYDSENIFSDTWANVLSTALERAEVIGAKLEATTLDTPFNEEQAFSQQMMQVAKLIKLRNNFSSERAVFMVDQTGFDTHNTFDLPTRLEPINTGMASFVQEMKAQDVWDDVVVLSISDFGRTLTSNGQGTDHAWNGNYFIASGSLKGGRILGTYPDTLTEQNEKHLGRGRMIPEHSWEFMWDPVARFFGVDNEEDLEYVLPNVRNFEGLLPNVDDMFTL